MAHLIDVFALHWTRVVINLATLFFVPKTFTALTTINNKYSYHSK